MNDFRFFRFTLYFCLAAFISPLMANQSFVNNIGTNKEAKSPPLWEAGIVSVAFTGPIYPAAEDSQNKLLPVPFVIYRGETIRLGDGSIVKAVAVEKETFKFDVSLGAAFNASSDDSEIRRGMPDLDFLFEIGPQASFLVNDTDRSETWLNLQLRSVFSTDFSSISQRGYVFEPELAYQGQDILFSDSTLFLSISPLFASDKTHKYFYQVDSQYATAERVKYQADGGYLGTQIQIANRFIIKKDLTLFFGVNIGVWSQSKNADSPLFKEDITYAFALGLKWNLYESWG